MDTSSLLSGQTPLLIVHLNTVVAPLVNPLTAEVLEAGTSADPVPLTVVHRPVPVPGALPAKVAVVTSHRVWSGPAAETVGLASTLMITSSAESGQVPLLIVQRKVALAPIVRPVSPEVGDAAVVIVAAPAIKVHSPEPVVGVLPARVATITLHKVWSGPAAEAVGLASTLIMTLSAEDGQTPLLIVHFSSVVAPMVRPLTAEVFDAGASAVPEPDTVLQAPVPVTGALPAKEAVVTLHKV